MLFSSRSSNLL